MNKIKEEKLEPVSVNYLEKFDRKSEERIRKRLTHASERIANSKGMLTLSYIIVLFVLSIFAEAMYYGNYDTAIKIFQAVGMTWAVVYLLDFNKSPSS